MLQLEDLLGMSEGDLLELLADDLLGEGLGLGSEDPDERRSFVEAWLSSRRGQLQDFLCDNTDLRRALTGDGAQRLIELTTVADVIAATLRYGVTASSILTAIIVTRGYAWLCADR